MIKPPNSTGIYTNPRSARVTACTDEFPSIGNRSRKMKEPIVTSTTPAISGRKLLPSRRPREQITPNSMYRRNPIFTPNPHKRHSRPGAPRVRARNSKPPRNVKSATMTPMAHSLPLANTSATKLQRRTVLRRRARKDAAREESLLVADPIVPSIKPPTSWPRNAKTLRPARSQKYFATMVRGTSFISQHGKSRATIEHQMKKTLQAYTVILAFSATGSMTSVAVEETDEKKPPRVERSERGARSPAGLEWAPC